MLRKYMMAVACAALAASPAMAQFEQGNSANNLFSQYATQPGASSTTAGMYPAPHPVPANVGQTYYTYQPLMPHEMMYQHSRNYYNYYNTGGYYGGYDALNKTQVRWQAGMNHMGPIPFQGAALQALIWKCNKKHYGLGGSGTGSGLHHHGRLHGSHHGASCASGDCDSYGYDGVSYDGGQ